MGKPLHADFLAFREEFNKRAEQFGCSIMPATMGNQRMLFRSMQLVKQYGEQWPTWEEIEAGVKGMRTFGFAPKRPGWYLSFTGDDQYPNILSCVGHGQKVKPVPQEATDVNSMFIASEEEPDE